MDDEEAFTPTVKRKGNKKTKYMLAGVIVILVIVTVIIAVVVATKKKVADAKPLTAKERALAVLDRVPLIDGHNDLPWQLREHYKNQLEKVNLNDDSIIGYGHTTIPLLRKGKVGGKFWAAYMSCKTKEKTAIRAALEQIDVIKRFVDEYDDTFTFVRTADEILQAHKNGKIASLIGVESGHAIDSSLSVLRMLYELGTRYMTLTHSCNTPWADNWKVDNTNPNTTDPVKSNGLSPFGKDVVMEMNRLGMLVDLSHVSHKTMLDTLEIVKAPVIFSHSSAYSVCNHNRNVRDDVLQKVKQNGGVVMINFFNTYINCAPNKTNKTTVETVLKHIEYIKNLIGVDYIGMGSDYDGVPKVPEGLEDVSKFPEIFIALAKKGWTDEELEKIAGLNLIRAFKEAETVSTEMKKAVKPKETLMPVTEFVDTVANNTCRVGLLESIGNKGK